VETQTKKQTQTEIIGNFCWGWDRTQGGDEGLAIPFLS